MCRYIRSAVLWRDSRTEEEEQSITAGRLVEHLHPLVTYVTNII